MFVIHLYIEVCTIYETTTYYTMCPVNISNAPSAQYIVIPMYTTMSAAARADASATLRAN